MAIITNLYDEKRGLTMGTLIRECAKIIERTQAEAGLGREINHPMVSIFWGKEVAENQNEILDTYYSCWADNATRLIALEGAYTDDEISEAINLSIQAEYWKIQNVIRTAWFWDITDDAFETYFQLAKKGHGLPMGCQSKKIFFIFCRQNSSAAQEKTKERLTQLMDWSAQAEIPLVVLSDCTSIGPLRADDVIDNYRIAANLMVLTNTYYDPTSQDADMGSQLSFALSKGVFSGAYYACSKNSKDIVSIAIDTILAKYLKNDETGKENNGFSNSVQSRICGEGGTYLSLIDTVFEKHLKSASVADVRLWRDMPNTAELDAFRVQLEQGKQSEGGLASIFKIFGGKKRTYSVQDVKASLRGFWDGVVEHYYVQPIKEYLSSELGKGEVKRYFNEILSGAFRLSEMGLLSGQSDEVKTESENISSQILPPDEKDFTSVNELLHATALCEAKRSVARQLLEWLAETMTEFGKNAVGFEDLLKKVRSGIHPEKLEQSIRERYGSYTESLIFDHPKILTQYIRPTGDEKELFEQLKETFSALAFADSRKVFFQSLQDDLKFRTAGGADNKVLEVISRCFSYNMPQSGRLAMRKLPGGRYYTILNGEIAKLTDGIDVATIGESFVVERSVRIERLFLFPVDPEDIMFTNSLA